jgi:hypothetical protein
MGGIAAAMAASPSIASADTTATPASRPDRILSNETTFTRWTIADYSSAIRAQPSPSARRVANLHFQTPDGNLQSYVLLRQRWIGSRSWVLLRIPGRPNGRTGWAPRGALDQFQLVHTQLIVNRGARRITLYRNGHVALVAPVGVGKPSTPTPGGHFWITNAFGVSGNPAYGPFAFATSDYSVLSDWIGGGIVGIHGTDQPGLVPGDPSHGCIRMHNGDVSRLWNLIGRESAVGTPLWVQ